MEATMDKQQSAMVELHNSFWRDDQVTILFQSSSPLVVNGIFKQEPLQEINVQQQLVNINGFLQEQDIPARLHFLDDSDQSVPNPPQLPLQFAMKMNDMANNSQLPAGVYAFGFHEPTESMFGLIRTSVISFLKIVPNSSMSGSGNSSMKMHGTSGDGNGNGQDGSMDSLVVQIVQKLNEKLQDLNDMGTPITIAAATWLTGGTPGGAGQGCPLTPAMPVADSCSNWHFKLSHLSDDLKSKKGHGVTVFILDSFPERGVIARAARLAGDDNLLLMRVNETAKFDYSFMSGVQDLQEIGDTNGTFVGKDVYGRHYPIRLEDHGLFIAGIVHDLAPRAQIECIRVLDDLCVGDTQVIAKAINQIYFRTALSSGDLYGKPVVVNLSLVIPNEDEAKSQGITPLPLPVGSPAESSNNPWASLEQPLRSLTSLGVIVVAATGNEDDQREVSIQYRPPALYPAAFAYKPFFLDGIIPVGAVDSSGKVTSYSCYPGDRGIATYGGETPAVVPPSPPYPTSGNPDVRPTDMMRGIYSSVEYPPLSLDPPAQYYTAPNDHAWAYWVGTSFATPIVASLAARVLELQAEGGSGGSAQQAIMNAASDTTLWDRLDPSTTGGSGTAIGNMLLAVQHCVRTDRDEKDHEDEDEVVNVVVNVNEFNT
jgi:subtilisin family serine protease